MTTHIATHAPAPPRASRESLVYALAIFIFVLSAFISVYFCRTMAGGMSMPGGWTMSMMWMPMPGQTWAAAVAMFLAMWLAMMVAMMLPSALPMLMIYRRVLAFRRERHAFAAAFLMACGYFFVWLGVGVLAFAAGVVVAWAAMRWPAVSRLVPLASGAALIVCGVYQFTPWKMACLRHCRDPLSFCAEHLHSGPRGGWQMGLHHGAFCALCCWGLMLIQLVLGVMSLTVMAAVAAVIALEKLIPRAEPIVRAIGASAMVGGMIMIARSMFYRR